MSESRKFYGKFRGSVVNNVDPMQIGRIQAMVPDVAALLPGWGEVLPWALRTGSQFRPDEGPSVTSDSAIPTRSSARSLARIASASAAAGIAQVDA